MKINRLNESQDKIAVVGFGNMNPPTKGHLEQINGLKAIAKEVGGTPMQYLSHTYNPKRGPLTYDKKVEYCKKAFGDVVIDSPARTVIEVLTEIYNKGYNKVIYVAGKDREDMKDLIAYYNVNPDKTGKRLYHFDSVDFKSSGNRKEGVSGTQLRTYAADGDFENFKKLAAPMDDASVKQMYNDVRTGLGIKEGLKNNINEDFTNFRTPLVNLFKSYLNPNVNLKNYQHKDEICRFQLKDFSKIPVDLREESLKNYTEALVDNIKQELITGPIEFKKNYFLTNIDLVGYKNYRGEADVSNKFNAYKVVYSYYKLGDEDNIQTQEAYIIINTGDRKSSTAVNIMRPIKDVPYKEMSEYITNYNIPDYDLYHQLLVEAAEKDRVSVNGDIHTLLYKGNFKFDFNISSELRHKLLERNNRSIEIDFAEVFGSVAFANAISQKIEKNKEDTLITFPGGSNEALIDYTIVNKFFGKDGLKVSAKTGEGGSPSSKSMAEAIIKYFNENNVPEEYTDGFEFAKWLYNNVAKVGTQQGFDNIKNLLIDLSHNDKPGSWCDKFDVPIIPELQQAINFNIEDSKNIDEFINLCNEVVKVTGGQKLGKLKAETLSNAANKNAVKLYLETVKIKGLSTLMINIFNNSVLKDELNELFRLSFGVMVQVYLEEPNLESSSKFSFHTKTTETSQYRFLHNTGIDSDTFILGNQRLAMKLKD